MLDKSQEDIGVSGFLNGHGCDHAVQAHCTQNGHDFPVTSGRTLMDAPASLTTRTEPRHRGRDTALIQKDQPLRRDRSDVRDELFALFAVGFRIALAGVE